MLPLFFSRLNFLGRFWRGDYGLPVSVFLFGFLFYGAGVAAILGLTRVMYAEPFDPRLIAKATIATWIVTVLVVGVHSTGVWRSATHCLALAPRSRWRKLCVTVTKLGVVAVILLIGARFNQVGIAQIEGAWRMAYRGDPDVAPFALRLMRENTEMEITGGYKYGLTQQVRALAREAPNLKVVHLASGGGRVGEALELAKWIKERDVATYVASTCQSACTVAFLAGHGRFLKTGAQLGFHRASFAGSESSDLMRRLLLDASIERTFVDRVEAEPASGMWYPTPAELQAARFVTETVDNRRFAASGLGIDPPLAVFAKDLRANQLYRAFEEAEPRTFRVLVETYEQRYRLGQSGAEIEEGLAQLVAPRLRAHIAAADNEVMIDYANLMADQFTAIGGRDPQSCFQRLTQGATAAQSAYFSAALREREAALQARAVRSTYPRAPVPPDILIADYATIFKQLAGTYKPEELALFGHAEKVAPAQYALYCRMGIAIFRGIAALPPMRAGDVMSSIFAGMNAALEKK